MNGGRTDASTSTDDIKGRPLCLFYFTHPFGVLSPEPPVALVAPPHVARTFVDMQPAPPFCSSPDSDGDYGTSSSSRPAYDVVHGNPVDPLRGYTFDLRRESSSMLSEAWFGSSAGSGPYGGYGDYGGRRAVVPYNRTLPPLRLPTPRDLAWDGDDVWPRKCVTREKFSLPPIELPSSLSAPGAGSGVVSECGQCGRCGLGGRETSQMVRCRRAPAERHRRRRLSGVQRMVTCLMKRTVKVGEMFESFPKVESCCWSVPLRVAAFIMAALGLVAAAALFFLSSDAGVDVGKNLGLPKVFTNAMPYYCLVQGAFYLVVHLLLLVTVIIENGTLCELYVWFITTMTVAVTIDVLVVAILAFVESSYVVGAVALLLSIATPPSNMYLIVMVANYRMSLS